MTSLYAADEVRRNCAGQAQRSRFERLLEQTDLVSDVPGAGIPAGIVLPAKDVPILAAAIQAGADYLITGDKGHFGRCRDLPIQTHLGMLVIQEPALSLIEHRDRLW